MNRYKVCFKRSDGVWQVMRTFATMGEARAYVREQWTENPGEYFVSVGGQRAYFDPDSKEESK